MTEPSTCATSAPADACASRGTRTEAELRALMARAVREAPDDATRVGLIEAFLEPRWQALRPGGGATGRPHLQDWAQGLALRAAASGVGRETRRVTGFAPGELRRRIAEEEGFWVYRVWG